MSKWKYGIEDVILTEGGERETFIKGGKVVAVIQRTHTVESPHSFWGEESYYKVSLNGKFFYSGLNEMDASNLVWDYLDGSDWPNCKYGSQIRKCEPFE